MAGKSGRGTPAKPNHRVVAAPPVKRHKKRKETFSVYIYRVLK